MEDVLGTQFVLFSSKPTQIPKLPAMEKFRQQDKVGRYDLSVCVSNMKNYLYCVFRLCAGWSFWSFHCWIRYQHAISITNAARPICESNYARNEIKSWILCEKLCCCRCYVFQLLNV